MVTVDKEGKQRKRYPYKAMMTPYEKLKSLPQATQYLKPAESFENLDAYALGMSDNEAASKLTVDKTTKLPKKAKWRRLGDFTQETEECPLISKNR